MNRKRWTIGLLTLIVCGVAGWFLLHREVPVVFPTLEQAYVSIKQEGFLCVSDRVDGEIGAGFLVSREELTWAEVNSLVKAGPMGENWKGKVWVSYDSGRSLVIIPENAHARVWGNVLAFGDKDFLTEIDSALQRQTYRVL